ncbi:MAG TPA: NUDIX hydrolase [Acidimicrobiales bacterium]|jgi:8-oxo-dGTP diphosphatase
MRDWTVAGGLLESDEGLLLVCNRRRNGSLDWSPPGGVIEVADGESLLDGLTREVEEETGVRVTEWAGPLYEVSAEAADLGWRLRAEVHVAVDFHGELRVEDPDGIVVDACWVSLDDCASRLESCHPWVREPLGEWLAARWSHHDAPSPYGYRVDGSDLATLVVTRLH